MRQKRVPKPHKPRSPRYDLRLYVAGSGERSLRLIDCLKRACEKHAAGQYHLSVVDIYTQPEEAVKAQVIAVPTLVRHRPAPLRIFVGDFRGLHEQDARFAWLTAAS